MARNSLLKMAAITMCATAAISASPAYPQSSTAQITVLYDAFGKTSTLRKDWGFSALIEYGGKRILFDTGNNADIFSNELLRSTHIQDLHIRVVQSRYHLFGRDCYCRIDFQFERDGRQPRSVTADRPA